MNYDDEITKTPKPSAPSYTVNAKPTATYTIDSKDSRPTTTKVPKPYTEPLGLTTEDEVQLLYESEINIVIQGTP